MSFQGKRYWLVGASEGLGRALTKELSKLGAELVISARNEKRLQELVQETDAQAVPLDVTDKPAVEKARSEIGALDGVIYAAGVYTPLKSSDWDSDAVEQMIEINFLGAARVLGSVVPEFAKNGRGHIVIIGSLSGFRGLPSAIGYGASKSGLMHLAENLHADLRASGVKVQLINPGFIKTRLTDKNEFKMPFIMSADDAALQVVQAMQSERFQSNFPRPFSWLFRGANFLPAPLYYRLFGAKREKI
jgi:short-subunit dehydrogenase